MNSLRLNFLLLGLLALFAFLQYRLWFQQDGIRDMQMLKKSIQAQKNENEYLKKTNDELLAQIERLKNSQDTTEAHARNELGMIKKGETFYQIVK